MDLFPLHCLFPRAQLSYWVLSFMPSFVVPSLLMDPVPLPVSSHGPIFVPPSLPTEPALLSGLVFQAQFHCSVSSHGPGSFARLFSRTQFRCRLFSRTHFCCPSLLTDPFSLPVSSHGPIFVAPSLPTDPALLSGLVFQAQFHCPVSSHGPSSFARLFSRAQFRCSVFSYGPSSAVPSHISDPVPFLRLFSRTQFSAPCICPSYSTRSHRTQYGFSSL